MKYIVIAGNERQAQDWISDKRREEEGLTRRDVLVVRSPRNLRGIRPEASTKIAYVGTWWERRDAGEISDIVHYLDRFCPMELA